MQQLSPGMGVCLRAGSALQRPAVPGRILERLAQPADQSPVAAAIRAVSHCQHAGGIGSAERPHHGRGILHVTARDQVLQRGQQGMIQSDVRRSLGLGPHRSGYAGQGRREEDNANWCRHCGET
jgi:hypothetical protein